MDELLSIEELESRMRPLQWSHGGFLGPSERLLSVIERDAETLSALGLTHEGISDSLEALLLAQMRLDLETRWRELPITPGQRLQVEIAVSMGSQTCPWARVSEQELARHADEPPSMFPGMARLACDAGFPMLGEDRAGAFGWWIRNLRSGQLIRGPGLAPHLIREHRFFEGPESPYRVDPRQLAEVLELGPFARDDQR